MKYTEVVFTCSGGDGWEQDVLIQDLGQLGFDTFEPRENGFAGYIATEQLDLSSLESLIIHQPMGFHVSYTLQEIPPKNWNEIWESNFDPVNVGDQCYIRATFHPANTAFRYEIIIDPKMAFGTGHHQTTCLMVGYLLEAVVIEKRVLDMGCGTGILAILAAKMGASTVVAIDNDPVCIASVTENKVLNGVPSIVERQGSIGEIKAERYDIILANINRNILLDHMASYAEALNPGGQLFISGFYDGGDLEILRESASRYRLQFLDHRTADEWAAARFVKNG